MFTNGLGNSVKRLKNDTWFPPFVKHLKSIKVRIKIIYLPPLQEVRHKAKCVLDESVYAEQTGFKLDSKDQEQVE